MRDELRQSLALLPRRSELWIWISKPVESRIKKFICRRSVPTGALSVEGPAKDELRRAVMFSSHPSKPMVDQRRFSDPGPCNDCDDVDIFVCPCTIQKSDILLSTKNITSGDRQSGYGNLLRCKSCWRLAGSETRSGRGRLQEAVTSDSTPCVDCACYRRYSLQQLVRSLETLCRILLKEFLKENYDRLRDTFELFNG
jgi:hypothetical protein